MRFSLGSGFLYINKHVCKQICPVWLQGRKDWIHAPVGAPCGVGDGRGGLHPFCFGFRLFNPPSPYFFSYLGLVQSPSRRRTRMSRNSSLESQAFVKRASTGNRLLWNIYQNDLFYLPVTAIYQYIQRTISFTTHIKTMNRR